MSDSENMLTQALGTFSALKKSINKIPQGDNFEYASVFSTFSEPIEDISLNIVRQIQKLLPQEAEMIFGLHERRDLFDFTNVITEVVECDLKVIESCLDAMNEDKFLVDDQQIKQFETQFSDASRINRPILDPPPNNALQEFSPFYRDINDVEVIGEPGVHPYEEYISGWTVPAAQLQPMNERNFNSLKDTPLVFVSTLKELKELRKALDEVDEFAVDLEHHQYHSYFGLTCLMQLSTSTTDYIVDVIALRNHMYLLKSPFLSSSKVKVFHGAAEDMKWLQRDFGLYVCNMFDTGIALQRLRQPRGLGFLLKFICGISVDKSYQLADWRVRPLSEGLIDYARGDTHYLLHCYSKLRNMLGMSEDESNSGNLLKSVWEESRQLCLSLYTIPEVNEALCDDTFIRHYNDLDAQQISIIRDLFVWRDKKSRELDESYPALMSNGILARIAKQRPVTTEEFTLYFGKRKTILNPFVHEVLSVITQVIETVSKDAIITTISTNLSTRTQKESASSYLAQSHVEFSGTLPTIDGQLEESTSDISAHPKKARKTDKEKQPKGVSLYDVYLS